jgi:hypothetical protein
MAGRAFLFTARLALGLACACGGVDEDLDLGETEAAARGAATPGGETVVRWSENNFALLTTLDSGAPAGLQLIRELPIVHLAMHDAANGVRRRYERYALREEDPRADPALAAAAAAHAAIAALRPGKRAQVDALLETDVRRVSDADVRRRSLALGAAAAAAILERRANDGFFDVVPYTFGPPAPGVWQPVPPAGASAIGPQLPFVRPLALVSADQFRAPPPPPLSSVWWKLDHDDVKAVGRRDSAVRTADQTAAALFWREQVQFAWNRIARAVATENDQGLWRTARAFALVNVGIFDALVANFDTKYHYQYWRPYTAIREVDDGRADTVMDPGWEPLNATPGHPEYSTGQAALGAAAAYPLLRIYGPHVGFSVTTSTAEPAGATRAYRGFLHAVLEGAQSRVWGGIHYRSSIPPALLQGLAVGRHIHERALRP